LKVVADVVHCQEPYHDTGKVVFITGAGRGIGKGIAQLLAEAGADVALDALTSNCM
jgi:NAD(P)-dependent dehydrogenase (short-subunit alcohol dehydrogenase family)